MIGHGGRINPALWSYHHRDTEPLAQELWAICGWETLPVSLAGLTLALFGNDEQGGLWLPGLGTCYTDNGTTPCTAPGQLVYRMNDLSGNGNHAIQATEAARPALGRTVEGGRRNMILNSEAPSSSAGWRFADGGSGNANTYSYVSVNVPALGDVLAIRIAVSSSSPRSIAQNNWEPVADKFYAISFWMRMVSGTAPQRIFNVLGAGGGDDQNFGARFSNVGLGDWVHVKLETGITKVYNSFGFTGNARVMFQGIDISVGSVFEITGWCVEEMPAENQVFANPYQRVGTTSLDVTEAGKPELWFLRDDGIDDSLVATFSASLGTACTTNIATSAGITTLTGQTIGTTYDILQSTDVFGAIVVDRALTAGEQAQVDAYLGALHP
jgi:hypothetical protein